MKASAAYVNALAMFGYLPSLLFFILLLIISFICCDNYHHNEQEVDILYYT